MGNRAIDDVVRLDPRVNVVNQGTGAISAVGMNNRYNNIAVDGVTQGDPFGLNANGLPYLKSPISPEAIAQYNISTANFDVVADTVGADVNAVTKSGTNDFHGSLYYAYRNANHLVGDAGWLPSGTPGYKYNGYDKDATYGFNVGGPIIKDRLFFFLSAEKEKTTGIGADSLNGMDFSLGNGASTSNKVSPGDLQKVIDAATKLGLKPGSFGADLRRQALSGQDRLEHLRPPPRQLLVPELEGIAAGGRRQRAVHRGPVELHLDQGDQDDQLRRSAVLRLERQLQHRGQGRLSEVHSGNDRAVRPAFGAGESVAVGHRSVGVPRQGAVSPLQLHRDEEDFAVLRRHVHARRSRDQGRHRLPAQQDLQPVRSGRIRRVPVLGPRQFPRR